MGLSAKKEDGSFVFYMKPSVGKYDDKTKTWKLKRLTRKEEDQELYNSITRDAEEEYYEWMIKQLVLRNLRHWKDIDKNWERISITVDGGEFHSERHIYNRV